MEGEQNKQKVESAEGENQEQAAQVLPFIHYYNYFLFQKYLMGFKVYEPLQYQILFVILLIIPINKLRMVV